mgnify:CR=1 FL=1
MKFSQFETTTREANKPIAAGRYEAAITDVEAKTATTGTPMVVLSLDADGKRLRFQQCFGDAASAEQNNYALDLVKRLGVRDALAAAECDSNDLGTALVELFANGAFDTLTVDCIYKSEDDRWPNVRIPHDLSVPFNADSGSNTKPAAATTIAPGDSVVF